MEYVSGEDLSRAFDEIAGDPEIIGALSALSPTLGALARGHQRAIAGATNIGRGIDTLLQMTGGSAAVAAAGTGTLTATPLREFKPRQICIGTDHSEFLTFSSLKVSNQEMLASDTGDCTAAVFDALSTLRKWEWPVIPAKQSLTIAYKNAHAATACTCFGTIIGNYTLPA